MTVGVWRTYRAKRSEKNEKALLRRIGVENKTQLGDLLGVSRKRVLQMLRAPTAVEERRLLILCGEELERKPYGAWAKERATKTVKSWQAVRKSIVQRDNYACRICAADAVEATLGVHHINRIRTDNRPRNLVTLCRSCHHGVHATGYYPDGAECWDGGSAWGGEQSDDMDGDYQSRAGKQESSD